MDVDIYRSITDSRKFVVVPVGLSPAAIPFLDVDLANLAAFKLHYRLNQEEPYQGADAASIASQVLDNGFAVFFAPRTPT